MDFDEAIAAHSAWKAKLKAYLQKPDKSLDAKRVGLDDQCKLGQWLHGEATKFSAIAEFRELKSQHANFHQAAADLIKRADAGEKVAEQAALGANSPFSKLSSQVVQSILKVQQKITV